MYWLRVLLVVGIMAAAVCIYFFLVRGMIGG